MPPGGHGMGFGPGSRNFMSEEEKKNLPQVTPELLKRVFSYLTPYWKQLALTLLCIVFSSIMSLMPSVLTGKIIDEGLIGRDFNKLIMYIVLSLAVTAGANLIGVAESYLNTWIAQHITFDMRNQMYSHLQSMSQRFFTSNNQGDIITRMTSDIDGVKTVISGTFTSILSNSITLIVALVAMYQKNWILATVGIIIVHYRSTVYDPHQESRPEALEPDPGGPGLQRRDQRDSRRDNVCERTDPCKALLQRGV